MPNQKLVLPWIKKEQETIAKFVAADTLEAVDSMVNGTNPAKGEDKLHGPYKIQETRTNGTVVVIRNEEGNVLETYNIRKIQPYKGKPIEPRARLVHQREGQADYFFIHQQLIKQLSMYLVERSIARG